MSSEIRQRKGKRTGKDTDETELTSSDLDVSAKEKKLTSSDLDVSGKEKKSEKASDSASKAAKKSPKAKPQESKQAAGDSYVDRYGNTRQRIPEMKACAGWSVRVTVMAMLLFVALVFFAASHVLYTRDLLFAVRERNLDRLQTIIEGGQDVTIQDKLRRSAAHYAAMNGWAEGLKVLAEAGAPLGLKDNDHWLPVHFAASRGNLEVLKVLHQYGANIEAETRYTDTPLHIAAGITHLSACSEHFQPLRDALMRELAKKEKSGSADPKKKRSASRPSTSLRQKDINKDALARDINDQWRDLMDPHAPALTMDDLMETHKAPDVNHDTDWKSFQARTEVVEWLVGHQVDVVRIDDFKRTAVHWAASVLNTPALKVLLKGPKKVTAATFTAQHDITPLIEVCGAADELAYCMALGNAAAAGANASALGEHLRRSPVEWRELATKSRLEAAQVLLEAAGDKAKELVLAVSDTGSTALLRAANRGDVEMARLLLKHGAKPHIQKRDESGLNPFLVAVMAGRCSFLEELIKHDKTITMAMDQRLNTIVHMSAEKAPPNCTLALVRNGGDVLQEGERGPAIFRAVERGHAEVVRAMFEAGVDPAVTDDTSRTLMHVACDTKDADMEILKILREAGVPMNTMDDFGKYPNQYALDHNRQDVAAYVAIAEAGLATEMTILNQLAESMGVGEADEDTKRRVVYGDTGDKLTAPVAGHAPMEPKKARQEREEALKKKQRIRWNKYLNLHKQEWMEERHKTQDAAWSQLVQRHELFSQAREKLELEIADGLTPEREASLRAQGAWEVFEEDKQFKEWVPKREKQLEERKEEIRIMEEAVRVTSAEAAAYEA